MGEISEYCRTWEQDENIEPSIKEVGDVWITGKSKRIELIKMTNLHIINTIRAWEGLGKTKPPKDWCGGKKRWLNLLTKELIRRQITTVKIN